MAEVPEKALQAAEAAIRERVQLRLGVNALAEAVMGKPLLLSGTEAEDAARAALEGLTEAGMSVVETCACGQPLGTCPACGDPRCWRCDPVWDQDGKSTECTGGPHRGGRSWLKRPTMRARMLTPVVSMVVSMLPSVSGTPKR